jgi:voltage-gated sodium channel
MINKITVRSLNKVSSFFIVLSAISLGVEANFSSEQTYEAIFTGLDYLFLAYFTIEVIVRFKISQYNWTNFIHALKKTWNGYKNQNAVSEQHSLIIEDWAWFIFDVILVLLAYLSLFRHLVEHPQLILLLRLFRVFRILRLFELNNTLKQIEKRILSTIPTIITFLALILIILYSYAIIGMYVYEFRKLNTIDFSSVYDSMLGLFIAMTSGWSDLLTELRQINSVPEILSDIYIISFFIFSVLITLNVFLAVMTSQVQDKIKNELTLIKKGEREIQKDIKMLESESAKEIAELNKKLDQVISMISNNKKNNE